MKGARIVTTVAMLLLAACGGNPAAAPTPAPAPPTNLPLPTNLPPPASPVTGTLPGSNSQPDAQPAIDAALQDAASHLGVRPDQLHVVDVQARQWPDSSLGCPQPGIMYSQIVTPGFLIVISTPTGKQLEYHTDGRSLVVLCKET